MSAVRNLFLILAMAVIGGALGVIFGATDSPKPAAPAAQQLYPLPHHIPNYPGGVSLRFAMVHDVIHERFPRHGKAYYEERNRRAAETVKQEEEKLASGAKPSDQYWAALDDLGVGLSRLGKHEEAVALMRRKLKQQQDLVLLGNDYLYSSYANLGTFLILWQIAEGFDKPGAKDRTKESIDWIHQAIDAKPDSHFGREIWQVVLEEFVLAMLDKPDLLLTYDMVGDRLDRNIQGREHAIAATGRWNDMVASTAKEFLLASNNAEKTEARAGYRKHITRVGAEEGWAAVKTSQNEPVPFDEPALGIIGMWRYGGGANPHFALALGEIMLRVGQRYVAWTAYERAAQLGEPFGPKFVEHCRKRQKAIEGQLSPDEVAVMRPTFEKELAFGQRYQKDYQDYEARRIREGAAIDDPKFYDAFHAEHKPVASPIGAEDHYVVETRHNILARISIPTVLLSAGIAAFLTALLLIGWQGRRPAAVVDEKATHAS